MKNKNLWFIGIIIIGAIGLLTYTDFLGAAISGDKINRNFEKTQVTPGETISVTYSPSNTNIKFWAINDIIPSGWSATPSGVIGGSCSINENLLQCYSASQTEGATASSMVVSFKAPSSDGTTTFTGEWAIDSLEGIFSSQNIVVKTCVPSCNWNSVGPCETIVSNGCGGTCTRTVNKNTIGDINCDNLVDWEEFISIANGWLNGQRNWNDFLNVAQVWVGG